MSFDSVKTLEISRTAQRLAAGYYAFAVAMHVAANPLSMKSLPPSPTLGRNPVGKIKRKDGSAHTLDLEFHLDSFRTDQHLQGELLQVLAAGALITLGNALDRHKYFDRAPILELVRHLRNGVAHGNEFNIKAKDKMKPFDYPAHNRAADIMSPHGTVFEINPSTSGSVLFAFIGAADVIDLLMSVEVHLFRLAGT